MSENRTAIDLSIYRREKSLKALENLLKEKNHEYIKGQIRSMEVNIAFDKKLRSLEKEQLIEARVSGMITDLDEEESEQIKACWEDSERWYNQKYGTDGK